MKLVKCKKGHSFGFKGIKYEPMTPAKIPGREPIFKGDVFEVPDEIYEANKRVLELADNSEDITEGLESGDMLKDNKYEDAARKKKGRKKK